MSNDTASSESMDLFPADADDMDQDTPTQSAAPDLGQETDEFDLMDEFDEGNRRPSDEHSCSSASVLSSVYENEHIHGRRYHGYKRGRYPLPNDDTEQQREEINHAMMVEIAEGRLFHADIGQHPQKIIDIGTGTGMCDFDYRTETPLPVTDNRKIGLWAIDVADMFPSASVIGTDLSAIQPSWVPVNVRMFVEDCEEPDWLHGSGFDLVHYRCVANYVRDFEGMLRKAYPNIKSGGWVEIQEMLPTIHCDDDTMLLEDPVGLLFDASVAGMRKFGLTSYSCEQLRAALHHSGFINIECVIKKIPISPWALDKKLRDIGLLNKTSVLGTLGALAAKPLHALDISAQNRRNISTYARHSLEDLRIHRYMLCCFVYGQKI